MCQEASEEVPDLEHRKISEDSQAKAHPLRFLLSQTSGSSIHDALQIKRAAESAEGCVKDFIFGSKRQPEREIEKLALNRAKEYH
ncbi:unnamed protein product [Prunus brigantina]